MHSCTNGRDRLILQCRSMGTRSLYRDVMMLTQTVPYFFFSFSELTKYTCQPAAAITCDNMEALKIPHQLSDNTIFHPPIHWMRM